jgi:hypothetical protein
LRLLSEQNAAAIEPMRPHLRLRFIGRLDATLQEQLRSFGNPCPQPGGNQEYRGNRFVQVEAIPYVPHALSLSYLRQAHLLLVIVDQGRHGEAIMPAKMYEYLGARRPILVLGPTQGLAARLVRGLGSGWERPRSDRRGSAAVLRRMAIRTTDKAHG